MPFYLDLYLILNSQRVANDETKRSLAMIKINGLKILIISNLHNHSDKK